MFLIRRRSSVTHETHGYSCFDERRDRSGQQREAEVEKGGAREYENLRGSERGRAESAKPTSPVRNRCLGVAAV